MVEGPITVAQFRTGIGNLVTYRFAGAIAFHVMNDWAEDNGLSLLEWDIKLPGTNGTMEDAD